MIWAQFRAGSPLNLDALVGLTSWLVDAFTFSLTATALCWLKMLYTFAPNFSRYLSVSLNWWVTTKSVWKYGSVRALLVRPDTTTFPQVQHWGRWFGFFGSLGSRG